MTLDTTTSNTEAVNQEEENLVPQGGETSQQAESSAPDVDANLLSAPEEDAIPEKYVGKSPAEIIKMHQEAERVIGRLGSEKGFKEKESEELRQRLAALEAQFTQSQQPPQYQSAQPAVDEDPVQVFRKTWEENPREAIERAFETIEQRNTRLRDQQEFESNNRALAAKYNEMKTRHSDFESLEPVMSQLANSIRQSGIVNPRAFNRPETLEFLYYTAKGQNFEKAVETEAEKKVKKQTQIREQKKAAFSESGTSRGDAAKSPESMTRAELAALVGYSGDHWKSR